MLAFSTIAFSQSNYILGTSGIGFEFKYGSTDYGYGNSYGNGPIDLNYDKGYGHGPGFFPFKDQSNYGIGEKVCMAYSPCEENGTLSKFGQGFNNNKFYGNYGYPLSGDFVKPYGFQNDSSRGYNPKFDMKFRNVIQPDLKTNFFGQSQ